jgi:meso-butanediol dehydrogenase / (S,S)-butanediol dehydrogenase / diacetyl reductase
VAAELGQYGITANLYSPGVVQTPMWDSIDDVVTAHEEKPRGAQLAKMLPNIPLGRFSEPADVAAVVSFLASADSARSPASRSWSMAGCTSSEPVRHRRVIRGRS